MADWLERIRESARLHDGSLRFRSAAQALAALERSRARWGDRGLPYPLRGEPPPDEEWPRGLFGRRRAGRRKRAALHEAVNAGRLSRFVRLVRVAYAPAAELADRLAGLDLADRRAVREALDGQRSEVAGTNPAVREG
ncbi:MAG: hypothetical protein ACOCVZ_04515 [Gemmatimonadota bacterium]